MRGIYLEALGEIEVKEVKNPDRKPGEALIQVKSLGICGSDIGAYRGSNPLVTYPRVIGHEIAGRNTSGSERIIRASRKIFKY